MTVLATCRLAALAVLLAGSAMAAMPGTAPAPKAAQGIEIATNHTKGRKPCSVQPKQPHCRTDQTEGGEGTEAPEAGEGGQAERDPSATPQNDPPQVEAPTPTPVNDPLEKPQAREVESCADDDRDRC